MVASGEDGMSQQRVSVVVTMFCCVQFRREPTGGLFPSPARRIRKCYTRESRPDICAVPPVTPVRESKVFVSSSYHPSYPGRCPVASIVRLHRCVQLTRTVVTTAATQKKGGTVVGLDSGRATAPVVEIRRDRGCEAIDRPSKLSMEALSTACSWRAQSRDARLAGKNGFLVFLRTFAERGAFACVGCGHIH